MQTVPYGFFFLKEVEEHQAFHFRTFVFKIAKSEAEYLTWQNEPLVWPPDVLGKEQNILWILSENPVAD